MELQVFLMMLLIASTLTGLATEAVKVWLTERNKKYYANALAGYVSIVVSALVGVIYIIMTEATFTSQMVVFLITLVFLSWLAAMVGYDKVIQTITQFKINNKESEGE